MLTRENVLKNTNIKNYNGFDFEELSNVPKINLRGNSTDKDFIANTSKALGIFLPTKPNTSNSNDMLKIIWLSPNEWLIEIYNNEYFKQISLNLKKYLNTQNTAITDVTENRTILKLTGKNLYQLLSKFMIMNLDKVLDKKSSLAQTIFVKVSVLIIRNHDDDEIPNILLHINRSYAQYIMNLLKDGSKNIDF